MVVVIPTLPTAAYLVAIVVVIPTIPTAAYLVAIVVVIPTYLLLLHT